MGIVEEEISLKDLPRVNGLYGFEYREPDERRVEERKAPNIKGLWQRNHEIVNLSVRGFKNTEIAEILNITPQTVSNTINSDLGKLKISEIRQEKDIEAKKISEKIKVLTSKALNVYHEIFDDESGECTMRDKKAAADTVVLELSGLRAATKIQSSSISMNLTPDELKSFKERGMKAVEDAGYTIVVEDEKSVENNNELENK